jgi:hypothetical protein
MLGKHKHTFGSLDHPLGNSPFPGGMTGHNFGCDKVG